MKAKKLLTNTEIASFCTQMSLLLNAGITPADGMSILLQDTKSGEGREILSTIQAACNNGESFYLAIKKTDVFPSYVLNMIAIGEESGNLDVVMKSLA